jgi:Tol biopolymer transport system component
MSTLRTVPAVARISSAAFGLVLLTVPAGAQVTSRVSVKSNGTEGNADSDAPSISADGKIVAFWSGASNLVNFDGNNTSDVFVHDDSTKLTERVSVSSSGVEGDGLSWFPAISADGRVVAFWSQATNLVVGDTNGKEDVFVHDRSTGVTERVSVDSSGMQGGFPRHSRGSDHPPDR